MNINIFKLIQYQIDLYILKWETQPKEYKTYQRRPLVKSVHRLFNDQIKKADDETINKELFQHSFKNFKKIVPIVSDTIDFNNS